VTKRNDTAKPRLQGIVPPLITPLKARDELDHEGLERLLEHVLAGGVHGVFVLGTTGEGPGLSYRLRRELIERVCRQVRGRVPVLVGITDTSFEEALGLASHAADSGANAVVASAPYYLPPGQEELVGYIKRLVRELPLPLFLYNIPQITKVVFEPDTIKRVADLEGIIGMKDSSGDLNYFDQLVALKRQRPDWSVLVGLEHQLAEATHRGGDGGVNAGANYHPRLFVELYHAVKDGDAARESELQRQLIQLGGIFKVGDSAASVIQGLKCACAQRGLCGESMAEPFVPLDAAKREQVRAILKSLDLRP
jgi:4-hydroxy-tetrahydrodipicolinate synthase